MNKIRKTAFINALATALYVAGVGAFMYYGATIKIGKANVVLVPITFLLLFVLSAAVTGFLIFGKPVQMYLDGNKKEALFLVTQTLAILSIITLIAIILLIFFTR